MRWEISLLAKAISKLTPREQTIIELRFGIGRPSAREKTQKEVADLLGISQSYISRLEKGDYEAAEKGNCKIRVETV